MSQLPHSPLRPTRASRGVVFLALLAAGSVSAADLALLPISQEGGTAETAFGVENALRKEVGDAGAGTLMARDAIIGHVAGARSIDISCTPADAACLKQLGELAGVKQIVSPDIKTYSGDEVLLSILVLDVEQGVFVGRSEGKVRLDLAGRQADVRALVRAAFGLPPEAAAEVTTGEETTTGETQPDDMTVTEEFGGGTVAQPPEETDPLGLVVLAAGGGAAVIGVLVGGVGLLTYGVGVLQTSGTATPATAVSTATSTSIIAMVAGGAGVALIGVGAVTAAVGGGLFVVGSME